MLSPTRASAKEAAYEKPGYPIERTQVRGSVRGCHRRRRWWLPTERLLTRHVCGTVRISGNALILSVCKPCFGVDSVESERIGPRCKHLERGAGNWRWDGAGG